ncbi:MAG: amidohydrolase, partial [Planctomycetia bacterium]|nr:amidohydrolase [Planctomycetia bacterium]
MNSLAGRFLVSSIAVFTVAAMLADVAGAAEPNAADSGAPYRTKYRVVNVHRHGALASEAALQAELGVMDRTGVDKVVVLDGDSPPGTLPAWLELQRKHPDRLAVFLKADFRNSAQPDFFDTLVRKLESAKRAGVRGVKVWKDLGMANRDGAGKLLTIDDPRLDPFWAKCGELKLPVLIHAADPREY